MPVLYSGQDYRLTLNTGIVLTGATVINIFYKKPDGTKGFWIPTIVNWTPTQVNQALQYDITPVQNDQGGYWEFQTYVEISGKKYLGEIVSQSILNNIK